MSLPAPPPPAIQRATGSSGRLCDHTSEQRLVGPRQPSMSNRHAHSAGSVPQLCEQPQFRDHHPTRIPRRPSHSSPQQQSIQGRPRPPRSEPPRRPSVHSEPHASVSAPPPRGYAPAPDAAVTPPLPVRPSPVSLDSSMRAAPSHSLPSSLPSPQPHFELFVWRHMESVLMHIDPIWDDEMLLQEIGAAYERLRGWRRHFSLRILSHFEPAINLPSVADRILWTTGVPTLGPRFSAPYLRTDGDAKYSEANVSTSPFASYTSMPQMHTLQSPTINLPACEIGRIRQCLKDPRKGRGLCHFTWNVTRDSRYGIRLVERWDRRRTFVVVIVPLVCVLVFAAVWAKLKSVNDAFTIAGSLMGLIVACLLVYLILNVIDRENK